MKQPDLYNFVKMIQIRLLPLIYLFIQCSTLFAQLNGNFTIGGTNPSFANFTAAAAALSTQGISGNVNFNVRPGTYIERFTIGAIPGSNPNRTVTFQAENGDSTSVILVSDAPTNATNYIVGLQNVSRVVFKSLSFKTPESGLYSVSINLFSATHIRVENCHFTGSLNTSTLDEYLRASVFVSGVSPNFTAKNCYFRNNNKGIGVYGGETLVSEDMMIEKNRFVGTIGHAVFAQYAHRIKIQENEVDSCTLGFGIRFCSTIVVQRNRVFTHYYSGILLTECFGTTANRSLVANNEVVSLSNTDQATGVQIQGCRYLDFVFNSLNIQSGLFHCYGVHLSNTSRYIRLQNNSVVVRQGGIPIKLENEPNEVEVFSHCNLYNGSIISELPPNSISFNPYYVTGKVLHVANAVLNNRGIPFPAVTLDFDGDLRNAQTPDIGADEYEPIQLSAGVVGFRNPSADSIYCTDLPLEIYLQNTGLEPLSAVSFMVTFNGVVQPVVTWAGNLSSGQTVVVALGTLALVPNQSNTITVRCDTPNSGTDQFVADDELTISDIFSGLSGTYTIGGTNPDFPNFSTAVNALKKGGLCNNVTMLVRNGSYQEQIELPAFKGSSYQRWLTFQGESGDSSAVILTASGTANNNITLRMRNSRFIKLKSLKVKQTSSAYNISPVFIGLGSDIVLENCIFEGNYDSNPLYRSQTALNAFPDSNLVIRHCLIWSASGGASMVGTGNLKYNIIFEHNRVLSGDDDCLNLQKWRNVRIRDNEFSAVSGSSLQGIYGLNLYNYDISKNRINITGVQATTGIYLINCSEYGNDISLVANNSISMDLGVGIVAVSRGMWIISCDSIHVMHNTVRHNSADLDNIAFEIKQSDGAHVINNVFVNKGLGLAFHSFGNTNSTFDHNVYFTNGALLVYGSAALSGVQQQTGGDQHSVLADPMWTNGMADSLTLKNPDLENIGTITEVADDIRGFARQLPNPDPGAFETPTAPVVQLEADVHVCGQTVIDGTTVSATTYAWNTGATTPVLEVTASGTFILTASNEIGSSTDTINILVLPLPTVYAGVDTTVCSGTILEIEGVGSGTCSWSDQNGNVVFDTCQFQTNVLTSANYILSVTDTNNCMATDTLNIEVIPIPNVPIIMENGGVLSASTTDLIQWFLDGVPIQGATAEQYTPTQSGSYTVLVTFNGICTVISAPYFFVISSTATFTENTVQINPNPVLRGEYLHIQSTSHFKPEYVTMIDAAGKTLYTVKDDDAISQDLNPGVYVLKIWSTKGEFVYKKLIVL